MKKLSIALIAAIGLSGCAFNRKAEPDLVVKTKYVHLSPDDKVYDNCKTTYKDEVPAANADSKTKMRFYKEVIERRYLLCVDTVRALKEFDRKAKETVDKQN